MASGPVRGETGDSPVSGRACRVHSVGMDYALTVITESGFVTLPLIVTFLILATSVVTGLAGRLVLRFEELSRRLGF